MSKIDKKNIDARLYRIANVLLLNASFIDNIGLLNGKMGIAIFFYQYGRYTNNKVYNDYAGELIDEIYEEINTITPVDFANGLTGIGWGIGYMIENKFVDADPEEALTEIDSSIYRSILNSPILLDNGNDLFGYGLYCISRLHGHENDDDNPTTIIKKKHLVKLTDECERLLLHKKYLDFNIQQLSYSTLNSLLWFLLEVERLSLFSSKVRNVLKCLPDYIYNGQVEANSFADITILNSLSQKASEQLIDESLKEEYLGLAIRTGKELNSQSNNDKASLTYIQSIILQKLIYNPIVKDTVDYRELFTKAFEIIDNEDEWNKKLDGLNKSNLGLTGLAGIGLLLLETDYLQVLHDLQDNVISKSATQ